MVFIHDDYLIELLKGHEASARRPLHEPSVMG